MSLSSANVNIGTGGIGAPPEGTAHKTGLIIWADITGGTRTYPSGFGSSDYIKRYRAIEDVEDDGITGESTNGWQDLHYHLAEFFQAPGSPEIWVSIKDNSAVQFGDITELQRAANGELHQIGAYVANLETYSTQLVIDFQSALEDLFDYDAPAVGLLAADHSTTTSGDMASSLSDLTQETANLVCVTIGQDGGNTGANLFSSLGYSITDLGAKLASLASAGMAVHLNIGWPRQFQVDHGAEFQVPALANGDLTSDYTSGDLDTLDDMHYVFLRTFTSIQGTFHTYTYTAVPQTNDLFTLERNRVINLSYRRTKEYFQPDLNRPIEVNADGTLPQEVIDYFEELVQEAHGRMINRGNISEPPEVNIDPQQDVLTTQEIKIAINLLPVGVAKHYNIPLRFVAQTS